ncbi:hypothetical protein [Shouchella shacheensis]|nr:hypothetical protein [Shouchella shacheensis]
MANEQDKREEKEESGDEETKRLFDDSLEKGTAEDDKERQKKK